MILSWLTPKSLVLFSSSCTTLHEFCSQDYLWKIIAKKCPSCKWLLNENENLLFSYCQRMNIMITLKKAWNHVQRFKTLDLNAGISEEEIESYENRLGFRLPIHIRLSFMLYNGQNKYRSLPSLQLTPIGRFLPLQEIVREVTENPRWALFPLTSVAGFQQWFASLDGAIYLISGWNETKKYDNWSQFLFSLCS